MRTLRMAAATAAAAVVLTPALAFGAVTPLTGAGWLRLAGPDRYATAVAVSQATFTTPQNTAFIASGEDFADALAAGTVAGGLQAPVLLVRKSVLPASVATELTRLRPEHTYVVGGPSVVSDATLGAIAVATGKAVNRIYGANRYETAVDLATRFAPDIPTRYYIASGEDFADALAGGPAAAQERAALVLTRQGVLPDATRELIEGNRTARVVVLGGTGAVSQAVFDDIEAAAPRATVVRIAGANRYETAAKVALQRDLFGPNPEKVFVATGLSFPDALGGTPSAIVNDAPIVLTRATCHPLETALFLAVARPTLKVALGGDDVTYAGTTTCGR